MPGQATYPLASLGVYVSRRTERSREECDRVIAAFVKLKRALPELDRRTRFAAGNDGYPSSSAGGGGGSSGSISTPTERAALSRNQPDPVRKAMATALSALHDALELARSVDNMLALADVTVTPECAGCGKTDAPRLIDRRCDACRMRARRSGDRS